MKSPYVVLTFLAASGAAMAGSPPPEVEANQGQSITRVAPALEAVTVTGSRSRSFSSGSKFAEFRATAPRSVSTPVEFDLVATPVLLTVGTGNTQELRVSRIKFPFESVQDSTVRNSDLLKIRLARFKLD